MSTLEAFLLVAGLGLYAAGAAAGTRRRGLNAARLLGLGGAAVHTAFLVSFGIRTGSCPVMNAPGAFILLAACSIIVALVLDGLRKWPILVTAMMPLAFVTALLAMTLLLTGPDRPPPETGPWTGLHIVTSLASYVTFALSFVTGIVYLVARRRLKDRSSFLMKPSLETVARINTGSIAAGVIFLAAGIVVGYLQARSLYGRVPDWRLDPKILLSSATLLAYIAVLALSRWPAFKGRRTALYSILSFGLVLVTFWASIFWSGFHRF